MRRIGALAGLLVVLTLWGCVPPDSAIPDGTQPDPTTPGGNSDDPTPGNPPTNPPTDPRDKPPPVVPLVGEFSGYLLGDEIEEPGESYPQREQINVVLDADGRLLAVSDMCESGNLVTFDAIGQPTATTFRSVEYGEHSLEIVQAFARTDIVVNSDPLDSRVRTATATILLTSTTDGVRCDVTREWLGEATHGFNRRWTATGVLRAGPPEPLPVNPIVVEFANCGGSARETRFYFNAVGKLTQILALQTRPRPVALTLSDWISVATSEPGRRATRTQFVRSQRSTEGTIRIEVTDVEFSHEIPPRYTWADREDRVTRVYEITYHGALQVGLRETTFEESRSPADGSVISSSEWSYEPRETLEYYEPLPDGVPPRFDGELVGIGADVLSRAIVTFSRYEGLVRVSDLIWERPGSDWPEGWLPLHGVGDSAEDCVRTYTLTRVDFSPGGVLIGMHGESGDTSGDALLEIHGRYARLFRTITTPEGTTEFEGFGVSSPGWGFPDPADSPPEVNPPTPPVFVGEYAGVFAGPTTVDDVTLDETMIVRVAFDEQGRLVSVTDFAGGGSDVRVDDVDGPIASVVFGADSVEIILSVARGIPRMALNPPYSEMFASVARLRLSRHGGVVHGEITRDVEGTGLQQWIPEWDATAILGRDVPVARFNGVYTSVLTATKTTTYEVDGHTETEEVSIPVSFTFDDLGRVRQLTNMADLANPGQVWPYFYTLDYEFHHASYFIHSRRVASVRYPGLTVELKVRDGLTQYYGSTITATGEARIEITGSGDAAHCRVDWTWDYISDPDGPAGPSNYSYHSQWSAEADLIREPP